MRQNASTLLVFFSSSNSLPYELISALVSASAPPPCPVTDFLSPSPPAAKKAGAAQGAGGGVASAATAAAAVVSAAKKPIADGDFSGDPFAFIEQSKAVGEQNKAVRAEGNAPSNVGVLDQSDSESTGAAAQFLPHVSAAAGDSAAAQQAPEVVLNWPPGKDVEKTKHVSGMPELWSGMPQLWKGE
jgi:hypothetical protein